MTTAIAKAGVSTPQALATRDIFGDATFGDLVAIGDQLVRTGFLPEHCKTGIAFTAIVLAGRELGMDPMRSLRSLQLVKGKVVEDAASQLSRFKAAGGKAQFQVLDETRAVLWLRHPNGDEHTETWTQADSKAAGLTGGMHSKFAKAMMRSRAITAGLKSLGWDGAVGAIDPGEMGLASANSDGEDDASVEPAKGVDLVVKDVTPSKAEPTDAEKRAKAEAWALDHCARIEKCEHSEEVDALVVADRKVLDRLMLAHPDLSAVCGAKALAHHALVGGFEVALDDADKAAIVKLTEMRAAQIA